MLRTRPVNERMSGEKKSLSHGWIVVPSKSYPDRVYFFNTITRCSTWENPCEGNERSSSQSSSPPLPPPQAPLSPLLPPTRQSLSAESQSAGQQSLFAYKSPKLPVLSNDQSISLRNNLNKHFGNQDLRKSEIENFDDNDLYFESETTRACDVSSSNSGAVSSVSASNNINLDGSKSVLGKEDRKELWWHFSSSSQQNNTFGKKSLALSDIEETLMCCESVKMSKNSQKSGRILSPAGTSGDGGSVKKNGFKSPEPIKDNSHKFGKRKKSPSTSGPRSRNELSKLVKPASFKKRDRTPAQTKLLKLRQKNEEMLKQYEDDINKKLESDKTAGTSTKNFDSGQNNAVVIDDCVEEMDWEPSSEELDAQSINMLRLQLDKSKELGSDIFPSMSHSAMEVSDITNTWILVLDTNVLVSCLSFIKELRDTSFSGLGYPILYIPWRVLQELDHLKDSRIDGAYSHMSSNVRKAISYLNENFKSQHPRCYGQSFEDFASMVDTDKFAPDDEILQTCIRLQKLHQEKKLTLLTNDKNLASKAIVSHVETYSKEEFQKKYSSSSTVSRNLCQNKPTTARGADIDGFVCELKQILKNFLPHVVETEMKLAFEKDWMKLAYKKPPWTLQDALDCFLKHWRSVFFAIFHKDVQTELENLYRKLMKKEPETVDDVCDIIHVSHKLLSCIKRSLVSQKPYSEELEISITKLNKLLQNVSSKEHQIDSVAHNFSSNQGINGSSFGGTSLSDSFAKWEVCQLRNLFKEIWISLNNFCLTLSNLTSTLATEDSNRLLFDTRLKLAQTLNGLRELIFSIIKILEVSFDTINERHPVIIHLSNFLVKLLPSMDSQVQRDLPKLLVLCCTDSEGRSFLCESLTEFRGFAESLTKANDFFEGEHQPF